MSLERWREQAFELCWHQHGGSGLGIGWASAMDLLVEDRDALLEAVSERRSAEAKAIKGPGSSG